jgi:3-hydroxyacyl-CoA dehydrogenase
MANVTQDSLYQTHGAIAVITFDNPPVNGLGYDLRKKITDGVNQAQTDSAVSAIVLIGAGRGFSGGADIREFNSPKSAMEPNLLTVISTIELSTKPVIAALHGVTMGGGFELALSCHFRVADSKALVGLPEVKLGLIPGASGTQKLPRVIGVEAAVNMIVSGEAVPVTMFAKAPLFDLLTEGDLKTEALAFANKVVAEKLPMKRIRDFPCKHPNGDAFFQFARNMVKGVAGPFPAPLKCIDAVEIATKTKYEVGMAQEREIFLNLMQTPESRACRHAFFAERAASKIGDVPEDTPVRAIKSVAVIGAGTMGAGIAMNFIAAGYPTTILEMKQEALDKGVAHIKKLYEAQVAKGKLKPEVLESRMALLTPVLDYAAIAQADLVIEAVFEDMGVKQTVFKTLDATMKPGAILATNTSTLDIDAIAAVTKRPADVVGLHFFSPANVMKLLEVVRTKDTAKDILATVMQVAKKIKKTAVVARVCDGFIGNRMIEQYSRQAGFLLEEGCLPQQVDKACEKFGFAMGPFRMGDLAGNDIGWYIRKRRYTEKPNMIYSKVADDLCEMGRFGQKTGKGWYDYKPGDRNAQPSAEVNSLIEGYSSKIGITRRKISDQEIVERLVFALVNEAAQIIDEGIAQRASDVDLIYLTGYGFPLHRGGPLCYADQVGLQNVINAIHVYSRGVYGSVWTVSPYLAQLAASGKTFN